MKKTIITIVVSVVTFSSSGALAVTTFGGTDCGKWVKQPTETRKTWLLGYLTGLNTMNFIDTKRDVLNALNSADQAFLWMDNYCKENPLKNVSEGGLDLFLEIGSKGSRK